MCSKHYIGYRPYIRTHKYDGFFRKFPLSDNEQRRFLVAFDFSQFKPQNCQVSGQTVLKQLIKNKHIVHLVKESQFICGERI